MSAQEELISTPVDDIPGIIENARKILRTKDTLDLKFRQDQLKALMRMTDENAEEIADAFCAGCGGGERGLAKGTEVVGVKMKIAKVYDDLAKISKTTCVEYFHLLSNFSSSYTVPRPKGVCLVLATWNFPNSIGMGGLVKAIACGCPVIYKPTERNAKYSNLMRKLIAKYMDPSFVFVVTGGTEQGKALLEHQFGLIYFVGGTSIARIIGAAAGRTLTPMVLELGGINPCIVDNTCNVKNFARRMACGAGMNNGQLCIRPQYALTIGEDVQKKFLEAFIEQKNTYKKDYKFIDERHFDRCFEMIALGIKQGAKVVEGSLDNWDRNNLKGDLLLVTLETGKDENNILLNDEVFGPCTIAMCVDNLDHAMDFINEDVRSQPLALHIGSTNDATITKIINFVQAGSVIVNGTCTQHNRGLAMSGIGTSGMGDDSYNSFVYQTPVVKHWDGLEFLWDSMYNLTEKDLGLMTMIAKTEISDNSSMFSFKKIVGIALAATFIYFYSEQLLDLMK